jgi:hypothetical protein
MLCTHRTYCTTVFLVAALVIYSPQFSVLRVILRITTQRTFIPFRTSAFRQLARHGLWTLATYGGTSRQHVLYIPKHQQVDNRQCISHTDCAASNVMER